VHLSGDPWLHDKQLLDLRQHVFSFVLESVINSYPD
jgi:hypothetical protein